MIRIFLVEDENITLRALKQKIIDLHEDYEVVGTAKNGLEAYGQIVNLKPDILITDIRMPDMDGITLIEKLRAAHFHIVSVILSGYKDFAYAQRAIQLGVNAYLLKPVELGALRACLSECASKAVALSTPQNVASLVIHSDRMSIKGFHRGESYDILYLIFANPLTSVESIIHPNVPFFSDQEILELFEGQLSCSKVLCLDGFFSNEKAILFHACTPVSETLSNIPTFLQVLSKRFGYPVTACRCSAESEIVSGRLRACRKCAAQQAILGETTLCTIAKAEEKNPIDLQPFSRLLPMLLHQKEYDLLLSNIKRLLTLEGSAHRPILQIQHDLAFLLSLIRQSFPESLLTAEECSFYLENIVCFSSSYEGLAENFSLLLQELFVNTVSASHNESKEQLAEQIEKYLQDNISQNITLQMLADYTGRSKVYLCRIFKELRNMTPIDYLTHLKIQRAQQLIREYREIPLQKLSELLGFSDVYYFSKVFKRIVHLSPSEFRNSLD